MESCCACLLPAKGDVRFRFSNSPSSAIGDDKLPLARRIYLGVIFPEEMSIRPIHMFFSKSQEGTKVLQAACVAAGVTLEHGRLAGSPEKLNIFTMEGDLLRLDLELARSIESDMEMESQAVRDNQLQLDQAIAEPLSHDLNSSLPTSLKMDSYASTSLKQSRLPAPNSILVGGTLMMMRGESSDKALGVVAEDDNADDDDEGSINDVEQPGSDGSAAGDAAQISLRALREAQEALTQRELQLQQLKENANGLLAKQRQDADLIPNCSINSNHSLVQALLHQVPMQRAFLAARRRRAHHMTSIMLCNLPR